MKKINRHLRKHQKRITAVCLTLVLSLYATSFVYASKKTVTISSEEMQTQVVLYGRATAADALLQASISLNSDEQLSKSPDAEVLNNETILIKKINSAIETATAAAEQATQSEEQTQTEVSASIAAAPETQTNASSEDAEEDTSGSDSNVIQTSAGALTYSKKIEAVATAYDPTSCYPYDGTTTADGSTPEQYHTIAASSQYPFGTKVYIPYFDDAPNGGIFVVEDRGGAITGDKIDIFYDSNQAALNFGRRTLTVYILE